MRAYKKQHDKGEILGSNKQTVGSRTNNIGSQE